MLMHFLFSFFVLKELSWPVDLRLDRLQSAVRTRRVTRVFQTRGEGDRDQNLLVDLMQSILKSGVTDDLKAFDL